MTSKKAYDQLGEEKFTTSPIGTGPFVVKSWTGNDEMVAEAQEGHWRITPRIKTLRIVEMPEQSTREAALLAGEVDITQISGKLLKRIVAATGGKVATTGVPTPNMFYMSGNYWAKECPLCSAAERDLVANPRPGYVEAREKKYPWVADPDNPEDMERARKVRWAMSMAIDRQKIGDTVLGGFGRPAYTFHNIFPGDEDWKDAWFVPHDPAKARQWLTEAGYPDGFALTIWSAPDLSAIWDPEIADAVAEMWRQELKLDVKVDHSPYAARRPETVNKRMNVPWLHGMGLFPGAAIAGFYCPTPGHLGGIELRKEICDIGYRNDTESTLKKRRENNIEVQNYLSHWQLQIAVATVGNFYLYMPQVKEWKPYMTGYFNNPESIVLQR